jgi:hypothetical protein
MELFGKHAQIWGAFEFVQTANVAPRAMDGSWTVTNAFFHLVSLKL